jgi:CubicO group peptidase (beta-lactamase class C family)
MSKQIIATGVMLLVADGKLTLDDPVCSYLENCPESWRAITIRHVLSHTSGLPLEAPGNSPFIVEDVVDVIRRGYEVPLLSKPGEKWVYSNLGYAILEEAIHRVAGKPWADFCAERIFKPLGMNATRTTDLIDVVPNRASGYQFRDSMQRNVLPLMALRPGGPLLSTLNDLIKWDASITEGKLLSRLSRIGCLRRNCSPMAHPLATALAFGPTKSRGIVGFATEAQSRASAPSTAVLWTTRSTSLSW